MTDQNRTAHDFSNLDADEAEYAARALERGELTSPELTATAPCAYPADAEGEHDHDACADAAEEIEAAELAEKAEAHRRIAAEHDQAARDSFERSDTGGALSQWGSGLNAQLERTRAEIAEAGGTSTFLGLFVAATGERVRAKLIEQADRFAGYGTKLTWFVLDAEGKTVGYVPHSKGTKRSKMGKLGLETREEQAPAAACHKGSGTGLAGACSVYVKVFRTDDGYPAEAIDFDVRG
jgi:hypothetical protein